MARLALVNAAPDSPAKLLPTNITAIGPAKAEHSAATATVIAIAGTMAKAFLLFPEILLTALS